MDKVTKAVRDVIIGERRAPGFSLAYSMGGEVVYRGWDGNQVFNTPQHDKPYAEDTILELASVTKTIVAALIFRLRDEGKLNIEDKVKKHAPEIYFDDVTIYHMLTHSSGGYDDCEMSPNREDFLRRVHWDSTRAGLKDCIARMYAYDRRWYPIGTKSIYSAGYLILQDLIERLSGMPVEDYARKVLFEPLGMADTHFDERLVDAKRFIMKNDYDRETGEDKLFLDAINTPAVGNAGVFSTVDDMMKFTLMFLNGGAQVLEAKTVVEMVTECPEFHRTPAFQMDPAVFGSGASLTAVGHPGSSGTCIVIDMDKKHTSALLSNNGVNMPGDVHGRCFDIVRDSFEKNS